MTLDRPSRFSSPSVVGVGVDLNWDIDVLAQSKPFGQEFVFEAYVDRPEPMIDEASAYAACNATHPYGLYDYFPTQLFPNLGVQHAPYYGRTQIAMNQAQFDTGSTDTSPPQTISPKWLHI